MINTMLPRVGNFWQSPKIAVQKSTIHGKGIFAVEHIFEQEVIMQWAGQLYTPEQISAGMAKPNSICGYDEGVYLGQPIDEEDTIDQFLNHSCDPNLWMNSELVIAARRAILPGTELTADYSIWEIDLEWKFLNCSCGSHKCRNAITGRDWQLPTLQRSYENHFLPCINERIRNFKSILTY